MLDESDEGPDPEMATQATGEARARWLPVADAAAVLGISDEMLRLRMSRQAIGTMVDDQGRVFVRVPYDLTDYVKAGVTTPEIPEADNDGAPEPAHGRGNGKSAAPMAPSPKAPQPASPLPDGPTDWLHALHEARIAELKAVHDAQIADLKAVIVELADRHRAEVERLTKVHEGEVQRLMEMHGSATAAQRELAERAATGQVENKALLIDVILALSGRK